MDVEIKVIPAKGWQERSRKTRIYTDSPLDSGWEPEGPECSDFDCKSHHCKAVHAYRLIGTVGQLVGSFSQADAVRAYGGGWSDRPDDFRPEAEVDHKVWQKARRKALGVMRAQMVETMPQIVAAIEMEMERELPEGLGKFSYSNKAGCGCGCSPGWIAEPKGFDVFVTWTEAEGSGVAA